MRFSYYELWMLSLEWGYHQFWCFCTKQVFIWSITSSSHRDTLWQFAEL